jgi:hypothetical protein
MFGKGGAKNDPACWLAQIGPAKPAAPERRVLLSRDYTHLVTLQTCFQAVTIDGTNTVSLIKEDNVHPCITGRTP